MNRLRHVDDTTKGKAVNFKLSPWPEAIWKGNAFSSSYTRDVKSCRSQMRSNRICMCTAVRNFEEYWFRDYPILKILVCINMPNFVNFISWYWYLLFVIQILAYTRTNIWICKSFRKHSNKQCQWYVFSLWKELRIGNWFFLRQASYRLYWCRDTRSNIEISKIYKTTCANCANRKAFIHIDARLKHRSPRKKPAISSDSCLIPSPAA